MAKKTNKTSHVLNLITNGTSSETEGEASDSGQPEPSGPDTDDAVDASLDAAAAVSAEIAQGTVTGVSTSDTAAVLKDTAAALKDTAAVLKDSSASLKEKEAALKDNSAALKEKEAALKDSGASLKESETDTQKEENKIVSANEVVPNEVIPKEESVAPSEDETDRKDGAAPTAEQAQAPVPESDPGVSAREASPKPATIGDRKVIVVNETSENDKISNEILNRLTDQLEQEEKKITDSYRMVNVMEQLLNRQNLNKYMEQYGVCTCSRCRADVLALILTRLPAKYVVVDGSSVAPIIGFYEGKFKIRILTEIIKSCMDVKDNPRHGKAGEF